MILGDIDLQRRVTEDKIVHPVFAGCIQPASIDLHVDCVFQTPIDAVKECDPLERQTYEKTRRERMVLRPHSFMLASTVESVIIPDDLVGRVEGKSSLARLGLFIHITAGYFDPGFRGVPTLELFNAREIPMVIHAGMPICQISFEMVSPVANPYGTPGLNSKYMGQTEAEGSKFHLNRTKV